MMLAGPFAFPMLCPPVSWKRRCSGRFRQRGTQVHLQRGCAIDLLKLVIFQLGAPKYPGALLGDGRRSERRQRSSTLPRNRVVQVSPRERTSRVETALAIDDKLRINRPQIQRLDDVAKPPKVRRDAEIEQGGL